MRFLHAADIHLDSPLSGLAAYPDAPAERLRSATRDAFVNLIDLALAERVDFLVIAGDLYDGDWKDFNTGIFFVRQMGRLHAARIPVFLLFGNHDAESEMTRRLVLPDNVHGFPTDRADTFRLPALQVALHGRSFRVAATTENLVHAYPRALPGWRNIGVLHTALEGNAQHAHYAPCTIEELEALDYDYWALGHVHEHRVWRGRAVIAYPGNLQGRHIRETGPHGALLVTLAPGAPASVERRVCDVLRWQRLEVDLGEASHLDEGVRQVGFALEQLLADDADRLPVAVRVVLQGRTPLHGELFGAERQLRAEILAQAAALDPERLWIEQVRVATSPAVPAGEIAQRHDALSDLQALLQQASADPDWTEGLHADLMQLIARLPIEVVRAVPGLDEIRHGKLDGLLAEAIPGLVAQLARAS